MNKGKNRAGLLGVAGGYILYLAYQLYRDRGEETTMTPALRVIFIALFAVAGIALIAYALRLWRRSGEDEQPPSPPDETHLK